MRHLPLRPAILLAALSLALTHIAQANVQLPAILSDNMCLQSGHPVPIWGSADPGEKITVSIGGQTANTQADPSGKWKVLLKSLPASSTPTTMTVTGKNSVTVRNILVGSVWICSGQSNMEFALPNSLNGADAVSKANYPNLRLFIVLKTPAFEPASDVVVRDTPDQFSGKWVECSPESVVRGGWGGFSAVGYYFGREILEKTGQPVGMIETSWGGTPASSWISYDGLKKNPNVGSQLLTWLEGLRKIWPDQLAKYEAAKATFPEKHKAWETQVGPEYLQKLAAWQEEAKVATAAGKKPADKPTPPVPEPTLDEPKLSQMMPTGLFNGMVAPLIPYAIQGAIWYQGESNEKDPIGYRELFPAMIADWRDKWGQGDFPFLFVQLANFRARRPDPAPSSWALVREAQAMTLKKLPNTGMATAIDLGAENDIHPKDKEDVALRLSLHALKMVYGKNLVASGPMFASMTIDGAKARISYTDTGSGLKIGTPPPAMKPAPAGSELTGFTIAGEDQNWFPAKAAIDGTSVQVWSDQVPKPVAVRYAWADNPECNLYNREGLPAVPFRTDSWLTGGEKGPLTRHAEKVEAIKKGRFDLVLIGDSITQQLESGNPDVKAVWAKYYAPRNAINLGYGGYRTENILKNLQEGELDFKESPKVFVLLIGTNDTDDEHYKSVHTAEETAQGTKAIVDLIRQRHPSSKIIIRRPYPCGVTGDTSPYNKKPYNRSPKMAEELKKAGELTRSFADNQNVFWIDTNEVFLTPDGKIDPKLIPDLVHPSGAGAEASAQALEPLLSKLLGSGK